MYVLVTRRVICSCIFDLLSILRSWSRVYKQNLRHIPYICIRGFCNFLEVLNSQQILNYREVHKYQKPIVFFLEAYLVLTLKGFDFETFERSFAGWVVPRQFLSYSRAAAQTPILLINSVLYVNIKTFTSKFLFFN